MNHYVYAHLENGLPIYIGVGVGGRAWQCTSNSRSTAHLEWMMDKLPEDMDLQFIASNVTKEEAHSLERQLVFELEPQYNITIPKYKIKPKHVRPTSKSRKKNKARPDEV